MAGWEWRGGEERTRRTGRGERKGKGDRERGKGEVGGIAPWSLGIDAPAWRR